MMLEYGPFTKKEKDRLFKSIVMIIMTEQKLATITGPEPTLIKINENTFTGCRVYFGSGPQYLESVADIPGLIKSQRLEHHQD